MRLERFAIQKRVWYTAADWAGKEGRGEGEREDRRSSAWGQLSWEQAGLAGNGIPTSRPKHHLAQKTAPLLSLFACWHVNPACDLLKKVAEACRKGARAARGGVMQTMPGQGKAGQGGGRQARAGQGRSSSGQAGQTYLFDDRLGEGSCYVLASVSQGFHRCPGQGQEVLQPAFLCSFLMTTQGMCLGSCVC